MTTDTVRILESNGSNLETYHTRDCQHVTASGTREIPLGVAERRGLRECKQCARDVERLTEQYKPLRYQV